MFQSPLDSPTSPENVTTFHSLKKLRRSVSGALGAALGGSNNLRAQQLSLDENWYLSRSAPNSLDSSGEGGGIWGPRALRHVPDVTAELPSSPDCDGEDEAEEDEDQSSSQLKTPAFSYLASGGHIMYLPEYDSRRCIVPRVKSNQLTAAQRSLSVDVLNFHKKQEMNNSSFTVIKYNNDGIQEMKEKRPESPWSDTQQNQHHHHHHQQQRSSIPISLASKSTPVSSKKGKKFTFQSTIRQIERKRIADRLSKEAEQQERQRKHEAEAMRLVEEEFQRKRAREKASLKEQLRLFSLQDGADGHHSLPVMSSDPEPRAPQRRTRAEPEGAAARVVGVQSKRSGYKQQDHEDEIIKVRAEPREYRDYTASPAKISR